MQKRIAKIGWSRMDPLELNLYGNDNPRSGGRLYAVLAAIDDDLDTWSCGSKLRSLECKL